MERCWCCRRESRKLERHHVIPRRYYKGRADPDRDNVVKICTSCHRRLHREHDDPKWTRLEYVIRMEAIDYGRGLYQEAA